MKGIVAIHQPNFFPWLGYFDKINRSDKFILLDNVQFQKKGGTWSNRVKIQKKGCARWLTAPISRNFNGTKRINEMVFAGILNWRLAIYNSINDAYRSMPFYSEIISLIEPLIFNPDDNLCRYNKNSIFVIADYIGLSTKKFTCSSNYELSETSNNLLISLVHAIGGDIYLCGGGASGYQNDAAFEAAGIQLLYQNFQSPIYAQCDVTEFVPGLSIIDALMNLGRDGVRKILNLSGS